MDAIVNVVGNNITAQAIMDELNLELIWSNVGRFPVILLQVSWSFFPNQIMIVL